MPSWPSRVFWHLYVVQVSQTLKAKYINIAGTVILLTSVLISVLILRNDSENKSYRKWKCAHMTTIFVTNQIISNVAIDVKCKA